jgi:hypothetical protein
VQRLLGGVDTNNWRVVVVVCVSGVLLGLWTLQWGVITDVLDRVLHDSASTTPPAKYNPPLHSPPSAREAAVEENPAFNNYLHRWQAALEHSTSGSKQRPVMTALREPRGMPPVASTAVRQEVTAAAAEPAADGRAADVIYMTAGDQWADTQQHLRQLVDENEIRPSHDLLESTPQAAGRNEPLLLFNPPMPPPPHPVAPTRSAEPEVRSPGALLHPQ